MSEPQKFKTLQELFSDPKRWTTHGKARDTRGRPTLVHDPYAACWCLLGALQRVYGGTFYANPDCMRAMGKVNDALPDDAETIAEWNDHPDRTAEEVLALVTKAGV